LEEKHDQSVIVIDDAKTIASCWKLRHILLSLIISFTNANLTNSQNYPLINRFNVSFEPYKISYAITLSTFKSEKSVWLINLLFSAFEEVLQTGTDPVKHLLRLLKQPIFGKTRLLVFHSWHNKESDFY